MKQLNKYILEKLVLTNKTKIRNNKFQSVIEKIKNILKKGKDKDAIDNLYKELNETVGDMFHNSGSFKLEWWKPWNGNIFFGNRAKNTMCLVLTLMNNKEFCFTFFDDFSEEYYDGIKSSKEEHLKSFNIDFEDFKQFKTEFIDTFNLTQNKTADNFYICNYKDILTEKLVLNSNSKIRKHEYNYHPTNKPELITLIYDLLKERGNEADLNDIDVSKIDDMSNLFSPFRKFNGDISQWDTSKVTTMLGMFDGCNKFNCDISGWDVGRVKNMTMMFNDCWSFNQDLSNWDVSFLEFFSYMFCKCDSFEQDLSKWNLKSAKLAINKQVFPSSKMSNKKELWPKALQ
jgi:surface protein